MSDSPLSLRQRSSSQPMLFNSEVIGVGTYADFNFADSGSDIWEVQSEAPVPMPRRRRRNLKLKYYSQENLQEESIMEGAANSYGAQFGSDQSLRTQDMGHSPRVVGSLPVLTPPPMGFASEDEYESGHEKHRAKSVVVLPESNSSVRKTKSTGTKNRSSSSTPSKHHYETSSDNDTSSEVAFADSYMQGNVNLAGTTQSQKKSKKLKLPWKRNKGRYTPTEEINKVQAKMLKEKSSSQVSLQGDQQSSVAKSKTSSSKAAKPPTGKKPSKASATSEKKEQQNTSSSSTHSVSIPQEQKSTSVLENSASPRDKTKVRNSDYETVDIAPQMDGYEGVKFETTPNRPASISTENQYEFVDILAQGQSKVNSSQGQGQSQPSEGQGQSQPGQGQGDEDTQSDSDTQDGLCFFLRMMKILHKI